MQNTKSVYTSLVEHSKKEPRNYSIDWRSIVEYSSARSSDFDLIFSYVFKSTRIREFRPDRDIYL